MTLAVLDASALLALLLAEPGSEKVRAVLRFICMTVVILAKLSGTSPATAQRNGISALVLIPSRSTLSFSTRSWPLPPDCSCRDETIGLSFGDRACLALASLARGAGADGGSLLAKHC